MVVFFKMFSSLIFVFIFSSITFSSVVAEKDSNSPIQEASCVLPPYPKNGRYTVKNYPNATPGESYPYVKLDVSCGTRYQSDNTSIFCINGEWSADMPKCQRFCTLTKDPSVEYLCEQGPGIQGSRICSSTVPEETVVIPVCRLSYFSPSPLAQMHCIDGTWDYKASCRPECGIVESPVLPLALSDHIEIPWHAHIYRKLYDSYKQICGGSLISSTIVISAAHCFRRDVGIIPSASKYAVAVGKLYPQYNDPRDVNSQTSNVVDIKKPPRFQGSAANYQDDIAMVFVETPFVFQTSVRPVCLNFDHDFDRRQLTGGNLGKAVSFANKDGQTRKLKILDLPFIEMEDCIKNWPSNFQQVLTSDKFCAGFNNGTSFCIGDSGVGLAFAAIDKISTRYYLRGVLSISVPSENICDSFNASFAFTSILKHEDFIKQYLI